MESIKEGHFDREAPEMRQRIVFVLALLTLLSSTARAGEYYLSDEKDYWWYWDDPPKYELLVPAKAESYAPQKVFDERSLNVTLRKNGPTLRISSVTKVRGSYSGVKQAVLGRWQHALSGVQLTTETEITTSVGVRAKFFVATGKTPEGGNAMIRFVGFFKGTDVVFLELWCDEKDYAGSVRQQWIKAVNTFKWR